MTIHKNHTKDDIITGTKKIDRKNGKRMKKLHSQTPYSIVIIIYRNEKNGPLFVRTASYKI